MSTPVSLPTVALSPSPRWTLPELDESAEPSRDHCTWILIDTLPPAAALRKYSPRSVRVVKTRTGCPALEESSTLVRPVCDRTSLRTAPGLPTAASGAEASPCSHIDVEARTAQDSSRRRATEPALPACLRPLTWPVPGAGVGRTRGCCTVMIETRR